MLSHLCSSAVEKVLLKSFVVIFLTCQVYSLSLRVFPDIGSIGLPIDSSRAAVIPNVTVSSERRHMRMIWTLASWHAFVERILEPSRSWSKKVDALALKPIASDAELYDAEALLTTIKRKAAIIRRRDASYGTQRSSSKLTMISWMIRWRQPHNGNTKWGSPRRVYVPFWSVSREPEQPCQTVLVQRKLGQRTRWTSMFSPVRILTGCHSLIF